MGCGYLGKKERVRGEIWRGSARRRREGSGASTKIVITGGYHNIP